MAFWKPGTARPGSSVDRSTETEGTFDPSLSSSLATVNVGLGVHDARQNLPIFKLRDRLLYMVETHPVVVVVGQTGCGKTTQLPQYLMEAGWASSGHQIACTQPRRVAATSVAARVAQEVGSILGQEIGYTIRFEDCSHPTRTRIKYLTDGMLFRECMRDPLLSKYSVVMIDEAHERGAYTDLLLAILKKIHRKRPELRIIISSATIDAQTFVDFFSPDELPSDDKQKERQKETAPATATIVSLEGRMHPVELAYATAPCSDYVRAAADTVMKIHLNEPQGDILVFLTGRDEIDTCLQDLADRILDLPPGSLGLDLLPLHAGLTVDEQAQIFAPPSRDSRKVVIATNIAEASVTIDGIRFVVDCGFVKLRTFNHLSGMDVLSVVPESLASATQRAGRAGRTSAGKCYRLFPEAALSSLPASTPPEMCRSDISMQVLQLKALGIENLARFEFLPPAPLVEMMAKALEFLGSLEMLDEYGRLTKPVGEQMAEMPVDPMMAKILLSSASYNCTSSILSIAAMTSISTPFLIPDEGRSPAGVEGTLARRQFTAEEGDHLTLLNVFNAFIDPRIGKSSAKWCATHRLNFKALSRAVNIRNQLEKYLKRFGVEVNGLRMEERVIRRCLVKGYFKNAARMTMDGSWRSVREGAVLHVHPSSVLFNRAPSTKFVVYHEVIETTKRFMRDLTVIEQEWLPELAPHYYEYTKPSTRP